MFNSNRWIVTEQLIEYLNDLDEACRHLRSIEDAMWRSGTNMIKIDQKTIEAKQRLFRFCEFADRNGLPDLAEWLRRCRYGNE